MKPNFVTAYEKTMAHEIGPHASTLGYSMDPDDPGGETVSGVSRRHHASWEGWAIVDQEKVGGNFPASLSKNAELPALISDFYRDKFWNALRCDSMPTHEIAAELFDTAVNMGTRRASMFLQQTVNVLNRNQRAYRDIATDGDIGPDTMKALNHSLKTNPLDRVLTVLNGYQAAFYLQRMEANPTQEKWVGWFDRVEFKRK